MEDKPEKLKKRVDHLAQDRRAGPTDQLRCRQMGCDQGPLPVRQVACVTRALLLLLFAGRFSPHLVFPGDCGHNHRITSD